MPFYPTQSDIHLLFQPTKHIYSKVELLNSNFMVIGSLEGELISDSFNIDATSNIRRTYNCQLQVIDDSLLVGKDRKIWFNKYIRPYIGIYSLRENKIIWYLKGTFLSANASYQYSLQNRTLSLSCNDMMCLLTGDMDGKQTGYSFKIEMGENIRTSIIGILNVFGLVKYKIPELPRTVQYDLEFQAGATAYDMIVELMSFCPNYEFFFDIDGTFIVQRIPCYTNDIDILDSNIIENLLISEDNYTVNFTAKNCIEVWGKNYTEDDISRYSEECVYNDNTYKVTFESLTELIDYMVIGVKIPLANETGFKLNINDLITCTVVDDYEREIKENTLKPDTSYLFLYKNNKIYLLGESYIHAIYKNELDDSPFSIKNVGKELWEIMSGDEYDNITSDTLAKERAMYECYYKSNLNESLNLTLIDIPWLDVNCKIPYTIKSTGEQYRWIIQSISGETLSGQCNVVMNRFYPDWSEIFQQDFI